MSSAGEMGKKEGGGTYSVVVHCCREKGRGRSRSFDGEGERRVEWEGGDDWKGVGIN